MKRSMQIAWMWLVSLMVPTLALASFHTYKVSQIYSNADGSVQYVMLRESLSANGQNFFAGHTLVSTGATTKTFSINANLPSGQTAGTSVLLATQGFADLKLLTPDYIIPAGFVPTTSGSINFADVDTITYGKLPNDGVNAIDRSGTTVRNTPVNFAGKSASIPAASTPFSASVTPAGVITQQTLAASVAPASADIGVTGCVFVAALLPGNTIFVLTPAGWTLLNQANPGTYSVGALANVNIPLLSATDLTALRGVTLFAGYGRGAAGGACLADMLSNATLRAAYTIQ